MPPASQVRLRLSAYGYPLDRIQTTDRLVLSCCQLVAEELLHAEVQQHMWKQQRAALHPDDGTEPEGAEGQGDGRSFGEALLEAESGWKQPASPPAPKADAAAAAAGDGTQAERREGAAEEGAGPDGQGGWEVGSLLRLLADTPADELAAAVRPNPPFAHSFRCAVSFVKVLVDCAMSDGGGAALGVAGALG